MTLAELIAGAVAFLVATLLVPVSSRIAVRLGAIVHPRADRWSRESVPILGGLAVAVGIFAASPAAILIGSPAPVGGIRPLLVFVVGSLAMAGLGFADDMKNTISPLRRLLAESVVGALSGWFLFVDLGVQERLVAAFCAAFVVPVLANATNLVDNSDGLASSLSAVSAVIIALLAAAVGLQGPEIGVGLIVAGGCLGFLVHNRPPAKVFMGDTGSLMLGYALSMAGMLLVHDVAYAGGQPTLGAALALPLAFAVQTGDMAMVFVTRVRRGISPFRGGTDHTSHRLLTAGLKPWEMLAVLIAGSVACGALGLLIALARPAGQSGLAAVVAVGLAVAVLEAVVALRLPFERPAAPDAVRLGKADGIEGGSR